jgi:hypothetical protein
MQISPDTHATVNQTTLTTTAERNQAHCLSRSRTTPAIRQQNPPWTSMSRPLTNIFTVIHSNWFMRVPPSAL